jgi:hypothetical protein
MLYRPTVSRRPQAGPCPIGPGDLWSDDGNDPDYYNLVRAPHGFSHEALRRADPMYDLVLITDWNWPDAVPGRGRRSLCTNGADPARRPRAAWWHWIAGRLVPGTRLIIRA